MQRESLRLTETSETKKPHVSMGLRYFVRLCDTLNWWRWRELNPRPTILRLPIYMLIPTLVFDAGCRLSTERLHLSPWVLIFTLRANVKTVW